MCWRTDPATTQTIGGRAFRRTSNQWTRLKKSLLAASVKRYTASLMLVSLSIVMMVQDAYAQIDIGPPTCIDAGNCDSETPFDLAAMAYTNVIGPWIYPLFWGLALFMIQLLSHMPMLTSMVGVMIALLFVGSDSYTNATSATFFYYGYILVGISIGLTIFYIIKTKVHTG